MFTLKHFYQDGENYHAWSAAWYFVNRNPKPYDGAADPAEGMVADPALARCEVAMPPAAAEAIYPRISMGLANGEELVIDVVGVLYVENAAGKTIDTVRPRIKPANHAGG